MTKTTSTQKNGAQDAEFKLRWYQTRLGFWQAIWGTLISGGIAVAIPAGVDIYKIDKEIKLKTLNTQQEYISRFVNYAIDQDVELRIRFSDYFAHVAPTGYRQEWVNFHGDLTKKRDKVREDINKKEKKLAELRAQKPSLDQQIEIAKLDRELNWSYTELRYVRKDSNISAPKADERAPEPVARLGIERLLEVFGPPAKTIGRLCTPIDNEILGPQVRLEDFGIFKATMLAPAADSLKKVLEAVEKTEPDLRKSIGTAGSLCVRYLGGTQRLSTHAFGVAIDLTIDGQFATYGRSPAGTLGEKLSRLAVYFERQGWAWFGRDQTPDPMHFEVGMELFEGWINSGDVKTLQQPAASK